METDFIRTIDIWIKALDSYNLAELLAKPSPDTWSMGQVYVHLIDATDYYLQQAKECLASNDHIAGKASSAAELMFLNGNFPDELIEGPPSNAETPQPEGRKQLRQELLRLKENAAAISALVTKLESSGKTMHPGLGYFDSRQWFLFAGMHLRHHLRQKKRIDQFLSSCGLEKQDQSLNS